MKIRKSTFLLAIGVLTLILAVSGATYAYFSTQGSVTNPKAVDVTTATTDLFTLNIENELSLTSLNQETMADDATSNESTSTLATATLKANNATAATQQQYYMYLVAPDNPFVYTKDSNTPELLLKLEYDTGGGNFVEITNENKASYPGVTLEGLTYKTINSGNSREASGWDITTSKFVKIIENKEINAEINTTTIDKYRVTITFVNLVGQNQQSNTNKIYNGQLVLQKDRMVPPKYWNDGFSNTKYAYSNMPSTTYGSVTALRNGYGTDFKNHPVYIKTTTEHQTCGYYEATGKEFCISHNYWEKNNETTIAKLKVEMENALGVTVSCYTSSSYPYCGVSSFRCDANSSGYVSCYGGGSSCPVYGNGSAFCYVD